MLEILQFIFQDFYHWFGTLLLIGAIGLSIEGLFRPRKIRLIKDKKEPKGNPYDNESKPGYNGDC